jgi:CRP/FNR family transcriptional regulator, cyclic AMP receptor protein
MKMLYTFEGDQGRGARIEAIAKQRITSGNHALAEELADLIELRAVPAGTILIEQASEDNDLFLILEGELHVLVDGVVVARRGAGDHVGEVAAIQPEFKRTATVVAKSDAVVGKLTEAILVDIGDRYPIVYKVIAQQLAGRLLQRNKPG